MLKEGSHFDLPVALAVLAAMDVLPREELAQFAALGEFRWMAGSMPSPACCPPPSRRRGAGAGADLPGGAGAGGRLGRGADRARRT
jgi:magnesium chelatase family protein